MSLNFANRWAQFVTRYPRTLLLLVGALVVLAAFGLPRFKIDASADSLTLENDTDLAYFREVSQEYSSGDFLVVTYAPRAGELFEPAQLDHLAALQRELEQVPGVESINSILNVPLLYTPKRSIREIAQNPITLRSDGVDLQAAKQEFLSSPLYRELILAEDGTTTALQLNIGVDNAAIDLVTERDELRARAGELTAAERQRLEEVSQAYLEHRTAADAVARERVTAIRSIVAGYDDDAQIYLGGVSMIAADMISFIKQDLVLFGALALLFILVVLGIIFRAIRFIVIPMATCLTAVVLMLGLVSWLDWRLTVISSNFVALLLIVTLALIIHLVVRYREYAAEHPEWDQRQRVIATLVFMARPCLYTVLTSAVAFASLVVSDIRPVIDFGWIMTIGLFVALILAFVLMPASFMLIKPRASDGDSGETGGTPVTAYCARAVEHGRLYIWAVALVVACAAGVGLTRLEVENRFIDYFHEETEIYQGLSVIDNKLGGTTSLDIIIDTAALPAAAPPPESTAAVEPDADFAGLDDAFAEAGADAAAATDGGFDEVDDAFESDTGAADFEQVDDAFAEGDGFENDEGDGFESDTDAFADEQAAPAEPSYWMTVGGLSLVKEIHNWLSSLPEVGKVQSLATLYQVGRDLNGGLNNFELAVLERSLPDSIRGVLLDPYLQNPQQTRITMRVKDSYPGLKRAELVERIRARLTEEHRLDLEEVHFSGLLVLYNNMLQSLFNSQIVTLGTVFLGILVMFLILFRSLSVSLVGILPNILAALTILGSMGLFKIPLDMMTITIAAITVGMGVDNSIHYIYRFKSEFGKDGRYLPAMHRAHRSIGRAMFYTSAIIIFGFSIMVLSEFIPTIYFGVLTGFAMLAALLGALFLLPTLILLVKPFGRELAA